MRDPFQRRISASDDPVVCPPDDVVVRLAVYTDYIYRRDAHGVSGERAFVRFMTALQPHVGRLVLLGRLDPRAGRSHYPLGEDVEFVDLPFYASSAQPVKVLGSMARSAVRFWKAIDDVDTVWLLGPYIHAIGFALLAALRRRRVVLGVRQDTSAYVRSRRPGQRWVHLGADILEATWRLLARRYAVVVVGPELARKYNRAHDLLAIAVSLVRERDLVAPAELGARSYDGELTVLTVGRLDVEKNPLLLPEILARLCAGERRWRMVICGEGPLEERLTSRFTELGLGDRVELRGYVPFDAGLLDLYRKSHAFLHVSWTEGFPQVLIEAYASCLPTVATAVGGVPGAAAGAALLVPPGDATSAADALERIATDEQLREALIASGAERARETTLEVVSARLADFLAAAC